MLLVCVHTSILILLCDIITTMHFSFCQEMVTQASTYLFEATRRRFYFRNVSILVPITWKSKTEYLTPKQESYDQVGVTSIC